MLLLNYFIIIFYYISSGPPSASCGNVYSTANPLQELGKLVIPVQQFDILLRTWDCFDNMTSLTKTNNTGDVHLSKARSNVGLRPGLQGVPPPTGDVAKLNANEMSYGPHPEIIKAAEEASKLFHIYPDPGQNKLREAIAAHDGFTKDEVVAGSGSDDMLDVVLRVIKPKRAIHLTPTFMYKHCAHCTTFQWSTFLGRTMGPFQSK